MLTVLFPVMVRETMRPSILSAINLHIKVSTGRTYLEPPVLNLPVQSFAQNVRCDPESSKAYVMIFIFHT